LDALRAVGIRLRAETSSVICFANATFPGGEGFLVRREIAGTEGGGAQKYGANEGKDKKLRQTGIAILCEEAKILVCGERKLGEKHR